MKEKEARIVAGLLDLLDDFEKLRVNLLKDGREFYICAQDKEECLHSDMQLPARSGIVFIEGAVAEVRRQLAEFGVTE